MRPAQAVLHVGMFVAVLAGVAEARAIPRFAARAGGECIQCHVNPSGGGARNAYGRNVFERLWLPFSATQHADPWPPGEQDSAVDSRDTAEAASSDPISFSGEVTDWLALGADFRAAYLWIRPDRGLDPGAGPEVTSTFFLMETYLHAVAELHEHVTFALKMGVYQGFEAWGLFALDRDEDEWNLLVKAGRFVPAFGIREVEHQLFTREHIGLGNADRDTGVELTAFAGPVTAQLAIVNGTYGEMPFDSSGSEHRTFEKAIVGRLAARADLGWLRGQLGVSGYLSENMSEANPLFAAAIAQIDAAAISEGLDELRTGAFLTANVGRLAYLGDLVLVRDSFYDKALGTIAGYASYQELSFVALQGLELVTTFEFMDPDVEVLDDVAMRAGFVVELFPWPYTEMRVMVRRMWDDSSVTGGTWDIVGFTHLFF